MQQGIAVVQGVVSTASQRSGRPDPATRILALALGVAEGVRWVPFLIDGGPLHSELLHFALRTHEVTTLLALLGLVLRTRRRLLPALLFGVWLAMPTFAAMMRAVVGPFVPPLWIEGPESIALTGLLAGIAWDRARRPGWIVALLCAHLVLRLLLNLMPMFGMLDRSTDLFSSAVVTLPYLVALGQLAAHARPSPRSSAAFAVVLLAWMPLVRIGSLSRAFDPVLGSVDERDLVVRFQSIELVLFAGSWLAFEALRAKEHDTAWVRPAMAMAGCALLVPTTIRVLFDVDYGYWADLEEVFYASLLVAVLATVGAFVLQLRSLASIARTAAARLDDADATSDRLVVRAWITAGLVGMPALTGVSTVVGAQFIRPNDPLAWVIYLGGASTLLVCGLASLSWCFFAFGLASLLGRVHQDAASESVG